jgi:hypothetical protein
MIGLNLYPFKHFMYTTYNYILTYFLLKFLNINKAFVPLTTEAITTTNIQCKRSAEDMEVDSQNDATTEQV